MRRLFSRPMVLGLAAGAALSMAAMAAMAADAPAATGNGVTFVNGSNRQITFYTRFGSDASCQGCRKRRP